MEGEDHLVHGDTDAINSPPCTLSKGTDFEVVSEKVLVDFQDEMTSLVRWFQSSDSKRVWPVGCNKSAFRKKTKYYEFDEKTGVLFRIKSKLHEGRQLTESKTLYVNQLKESK